MVDIRSVYLFVTLLGVNALAVPIRSLTHFSSLNPPAMSRNVKQESRIDFRQLYRRFSMPTDERKSPNRETTRHQPRSRDGETPTRRGQRWSTSPSRGWRGSRTKPSRSESPKELLNTRMPVSVQALAHGPASLKVTTSSRHDAKTVYDIASGKKLDKTFVDPRKLVVEGRVGQDIDLDMKPGQQGQLKLYSQGTKSYTGIRGKLEGPDKLEAFGPGPYIKRGKFMKVETRPPTEEMVEFQPPLHIDGQSQYSERGSVKTASQTGQVATHGVLHGNQHRPIMTTIVSNSPSHSPPPSPGKLVPTLGHIYGY